MKNWQKILIALVFILFLLYILGPKPSTPLYAPELPALEYKIEELDKIIKDKETLHPLKPDNEARIVWCNGERKKTRYSIVYLHGFSASEEEGNPVHRNIARKFGCNLYLSRLAFHGLDTADAMIQLTVEKLWESAKEAFAIGKMLGDTVILMGTSTGGTLALILASQHPEIKALINMSPNIRINNPTAWILNDHWGLQVARMVSHGNDFVINGESESFKKYWYTRYRLEALTQLEELLESSMNKDIFNKVKQPVLDLYYYKNEDAQDPIVRVDKILEMHKELGTPQDLKVAVAIPNAGDHVLGCPIKSKDISSVEKEINKFMVEKLHLNTAP